MTWSGTFRIQDVSGGDPPVDVLMVASRDGDDGTTLSSNMEGGIRSAELRLVLDGPARPKVGELVHVAGHFTAYPPPAGTGG